MPLWVEIAVGVGASATALSLVGTAAVKSTARVLRNAIGVQLDDKLASITDGVNARFDANDRATDAAVDKITEVRSEQERIKFDLATQFGGNGGGMREAINGLGIKLGVLQGAFDQHVKESQGG